MKPMQPASRRGYVWHLFFVIFALTLAISSGCQKSTQAAEASSYLPSGVDLYFPSDASTGYQWSASLDGWDTLEVTDQYFEDAGEIGMEGEAGVHWFHFKGLSPGFATVTVTYEKTWIQTPPAYRFTYRIQVNERLDVLIWGVEMVDPTWVAKPHGKIVAFNFLQIVYEDGPVSYAFAQNGQDLLEVYLSNEPAGYVSKELQEGLAQMVDTYDVCGWNGFAESDPAVDDGEYYSLYIEWENGYSLYSTGDNVFPENYSEVRNTIRRLFEPYQRAE